MSTEVSDGGPERMEGLGLGPVFWSRRNTVTSG